MRTHCLDYNFTQREAIWLLEHQQLRHQRRHVIKIFQHRHRHQHRRPHRQHRCQNRNRQGHQHRHRRRHTHSTVSIGRMDI